VGARLITFFDLQRSWIRLALFALIAVCAVGSVVMNGNPIGFRVDWNMPFQPEALHNLYRGTDGFTPWNYANGGTALFYPTLAPYLLLVSLLSKIGLAAGIVERVVIIGSLTAAAEGMFRLVRAITQRRATVAGTAAAVSYVLGTFIFTKLSQGVLQEAVSYALLPFVPLAFIAACSARDVLKAAAYSALTGVLTAACAVQTQYGLLAMAIIFIFAARRRRAIAFAIACLAAVTASAYAVIPLAFSLHLTTSQFALQTPLKEVVSWAPTIDQALRQAGYAGTFAEDATTATGTFKLWVCCGFALFAMALVGFASTKKISGYLSAALLVLIAVLAALPKIDFEIFDLVLRHVPAMFVFRESYRFVALLAFIESIGLAFFVEFVLQLGRRISLSWLAIAVSLIIAGAFGATPFTPVGVIAVAIIGVAFVVASSRMRSPLFQQTVAVTLIFLIMVGATPFLGAGFASQTQSFSPPASAYQAYSWLEHTHADARVLYLPFLIPMHPQGTPFSGVDPTISWSPLPSIGNYVPLRISKQFASALYSDDWQQAGMLANWLGFSYLDYRKWIAGEFYAAVPAARANRFPPAAFSSPSAMRVARRIGFALVANATTDDNEEVYDRRSPPLNYMAQLDRVAVVDGDLTTAEAGYRPGDISVFANQNSGTALSQLVDKGAAVKVSGGVPYGLALSFVDRRYIHDGAVNATNLDADRGWGSQGAWNSWWWLDHKYMSATEDVALVARVNAHTLAFPGFHVPGRAVLLLKYFRGPNSTLLHVDFGRYHWDIHAYAPAQAAGYSWFVRPVFGHTADALSVTNAAHGDGVVARAALVPAEIFARARIAAGQVLSKARVTYVMDASGPLEVNSTGTYIVHSKCARAPTAKIDGSPVVFLKRATAYVAAVDLSIGRHAWKAALTTCPGIILESAAQSHAVSRVAALERTGDASYAARPTGPSLLVLSTGFSTAWSLAGGSATHLTVNGYANGWLYAPRGVGRRVEILCRSVVFLRFGIVISVLALLATAALLLVSHGIETHAKG
jgi:hypothetical protein